MTTDLQILLIIGLWSAALIFVAYWTGVARTEAAARAQRDLLLDDLDHAVALISAAQRTPLYVVEGGR